MENIYVILWIIAGILSLLGYIPYIISILKGQTRPNRASWIIWALVGGLLAFSYMDVGNPQAIWLPLGYFIGPLITAILSLRYGYNEWSKLDTVCLTAAILSIIPWVLSKDATITLLINILIDMMGAVPTLVKTAREPETEDLTAWLIFFAGNTLQVFAVSHWDISGIYPIYLFFLAGGMVYLILKDKIKARLAARRST